MHMHIYTYTYTHTFRLGGLELVELQIMSTSIVAMSAWCDRSDLFALLQKFQDDLCIEALQRAVQRVLGSNQNMDHITLPSGLQSLTCGCHFNQNIDNTALPSGLQSLTFGSSSIRAWTTQLFRVAICIDCISTFHAAACS